jgi:hypothetical protein
LQSEDIVRDIASTGQQRRRALLFPPKPPTVSDMNQPTSTTDRAGVQRWLQQYLIERASLLGDPSVDHLAAQSLDACGRGRLLAAAALMLAAENLCDPLGLDQRAIKVRIGGSN